MNFNLSHLPFPGEYGPNEQKCWWNVVPNLEQLCALPQIQHTNIFCRSDYTSISDSNICIFVWKWEQKCDWLLSNQLVVGSCCWFLMKITVITSPRLSCWIGIFAICSPRNRNIQCWELGQCKHAYEEIVCMENMCLSGNIETTIQFESYGLQTMW